MPKYHQNQNTDMYSLLENLRDLDYVSKKMSNEMSDKNRTMQSGLRNTQTCFKRLEQI